jgi:uncharacterized membrane protein YhhN
MNEAVLALASILLAGLIIAEKHKRMGPILIFKTPLSILFVAAALIQQQPLEPYYQWVVAGLVFGLIGDVCLALKGSKAFKAGLAAFVLGHVLYVVAFFGLTRMSDWLNPGLLLILAVSLVVFWKLRPHLGGMTIPVGIYITVITLMIAAAWIAFLNPELNSKGAQVLLAGAFCFYVSDLFVARERFVTSQFANRLLGLPLYYCGQFCIAFSVGWL